MNRGFVSIVGAGPGDPELLTLRALRRLEQADLVLFDALVDPRTLRLAPRARRFFVGKRANRPSITQDTIHRLMIRAARKGERVVRLKGGDPFVLGRGGEEAMALFLANVPFEIVPGLSSAVAVPALAGIPVTHRGTASAFLVVSGHAESAYGPLLSSLLPGAATLVVLMGVGERARISARLIARGWTPDTPAALLLAASTPRSWAWMGRLAELAGVEVPQGAADLPGTIVVGDVVGLAANGRIAAATPEIPAEMEVAG